MANIVYKKWFLFQVEIKKKICTTVQAAPDQMEIPLNKLPAGASSKCSKIVLADTFVMHNIGEFV